jgi:hypothetical protein
MKFEKRFARCFLALGLVLALPLASAASDQPTKSRPGTMSLAFRGVDYEHRWSKAGQNEFTPRGQGDLSSWQDMLTLNVHDAVTSGTQLAEVANKVLGNYQRAGKIMRTASKPQTPDRPAEHLIVAVLGNPAFLEAVFARFVLVDGVGIVAVYSHRVYGKPAGPAMSDWLRVYGSQVESALMAWDKLPSSATLKTLPQSN